MIVSVIIVIALLIDAVVGEPRRWHPLVGFGNIASWLEKRLNKQFGKNRLLSYLSGVLAWGLLVVPFVVIVWFIEHLQTPQPYVEIILGILCLTLALGSKSLMQHARAVSGALKKQDVVEAREKVAMIVSRDTSESDEVAINKATIESVLENGSDAIFAAIFWFIVLGAPGVVLYRLANTLDAMWGYRTERFNYFGWAAARIDDLLNWIPARLTALSYAIAGSMLTALLCWQKQAKNWHGINPGVVMASGAGALKVSLGGPAMYHGENIERPELGSGKEPQVADIDRAIKLVYKSIIIWLVIIVTGDYLIV
ncbi:MAG: cobalamin biosynthesis protein [Gammaproteobacteria bacterium]|nr:cobalamin biosynthesis protein [Gammaproteobacteria bacterium]